MKNKKIINSLNNVTVSSSQKQRMLDNILTNKHQVRGVNFKLIRQACLALSIVLVCMFMFNNSDSGLNPNLRNTPLPSKYNFDERTVFYDQNIKYVSTSSYAQISQVGNYLLTITNGDAALIGLKVYTYKAEADKVLVLKDKQYEIYTKLMEE